MDDKSGKEMNEVLIRERVIDINMKQKVDSLRINLFKNIIALGLQG